MAGRIQSKFIVLFLFFFLITLSSYGYKSSNILVSYSFDDDKISTGPDTFAVYETGQGVVRLTPTYRFSGYFSIEIRDVSGNRDFPELQGYYKVQKEGTLYMHFAMLVTDPNEILNIALAGPEFFSLRKDGIGFWLNTRNGFLYHVTDSMPKKLFFMKSFVWYIVDVAYDIDNGTYDLVIHEEHKSEPIIELENQKNASNNPGSSVDKFSFIGDKGEDTSNVLYFVDDIVIGTDRQITQQPLIAPGRRKLFVDSWEELQYRIRENPGCIPAVSFSDFGITAWELKSQKDKGSYFLILKIINNTIEESELRGLAKKNSSTMNTFDSISEWSLGCDMLAEGKYSEALEKFDNALDINPEGSIFYISRIQALSGLKKWEEVYENISMIYSDWNQDTRFDILQALVGLSKGDLDTAEEWLEEPAKKVSENFGNELPDSLIRRIWAYEIDRDVIENLSKFAPERWQRYLDRALISEQYYFVLLWKGLYKEAREYAELMANRMEFLGAPKSKWLERSGDASFFLSDYISAKVSYEKSLDESIDKTSCRLKLSDVYYKLNDTEKEREYRERIYGSLKN